MHTERLLTKLLRFFSRSQKRQEEKRKTLKTLLKKLKKQERVLRQALKQAQAAPDPSVLADPIPPSGLAAFSDAEGEIPTDLGQLQRQWAVLRAQRKKGIALLRSLGK
jgi:hypothetical protein